MFSKVLFPKHHSKYMVHANDLHMISFLWILHLFFSGHFVQRDAHTATLTNMSGKFSVDNAMQNVSVVFNKLKKDRLRSSGKKRKIISA